MKDPIQIKRAEAVRAIRALADLQGLSLTDAVEQAVRAQLAIEQVKADAALARRRAAADEVLRELQRLPVVGPELLDGDLYDTTGMPK